MYSLKENNPEVDKIFPKRNFLSIPISSSFNLKMQELTDVYFETSEQHKSATNAKIL